MKITLEIPDDTRYLQIFGVRKNGCEQLLACQLMRGDIYEGAEIKVLWGKEEKERNTQ